MAAANCAAATVSDSLPSPTTTTSREHRKFSLDSVMASVAIAPVSTGAVPPVGLMHSARFDHVVVEGVEVIDVDVVVDGGTVTTGVSFTTAEHPALRIANARGMR